MAIFPITVAQAKELAVTGRPLLLARFLMFDGTTTLYVSTNPLNAIEGGAPYAGHNYYAQLLNSSIPGLQMRSSTGIDQIPNVTLEIADANRDLYTTIEQGGGFKGALLTIVLIFAAGNTNAYSSDEWIKFTGVCSKPQFGADGKITVTATATKNLSKTFTPAGRFQSRCGWVFPSTLAQQLDGALNRSSHFFECGYCPSASGTDPVYGGAVARGNAGFTSCSLTKSDCQARGMYTIDSASRPTGSFGGVQWAPAAGLSLSKSYLTGKDVSTNSSRNDSIYNQPIPEVYGTCWVNGVRVNVVNEANTTRSEVVFSMGQVGDVGGDIDVRGVVVDDIWVPRNGHSPDNKIFRWNPANRGSVNHIGTRRGIPTSDNGYNSNGDPFGSMAMIEYVIYSQVQGSSVRVLSGGQKVQIYAGSLGSYTKTMGRGIPDADGINPSWMVMDRLTWSNYQFTDLDIDSFINEAAWAATQISYIDITGASNTHSRFKISVAFEQRRPTDQVVLALLNSCNGQLRTDIATGLRQFFIRKTLADQQPSPNLDATGHNTSNYNTAVTSMHANGTGGSGYVAFWFDESTLSAPPVELARDSSQVSNRITFAFQNEENQWSQDSISVADTDDIARVGGFGAGNEVIENWPVEGICNFDQGIRVARVRLAEDIRGNELQDTRGSRIWKVFTNYRVAHLRSGDICGFSWQQLGFAPAVGLGIPGILVRILSVEDIGQNFETASVTFRWHEDIWYTDAYGQNPPPVYSDPRKGTPNRPPYPWSGFPAIRNADDAMFNGGGYGGGFFDFSVDYANAASGDTVPIATILGNPIINAFSSLQPPLVPQLGSSTSTGGFIPAGTRIYGVTAVDASGDESPMSLFCHVTTAVGVTLGTNKIPIRTSDPATVSFNLYGGFSEPTMTFQGNTPIGGLVGGAIVKSNFFINSGSPPDVVYDHFHIRAKKVVIPGVWWKDVTSSTVVGGTTVKIKVNGLFAADAWTGYIVSKLDINTTGTNAQPNYSITAQVADLMTLSEHGALYGTSYTVGDIVAVRATGKIVSANTIGDPKFVNAGRPTGLGVDDQIGNHVLIIAGTGAGQELPIASNTNTTMTLNGTWGVLPDATSVWIVVEPDWIFDSPGTSISNTTSSALPDNPIGSITLENTAGLTVLVQVLTEDAYKTSLPDFYAPFREIYIVGNVGTIAGGVANPGYATDVIDGAKHFTIDLANGFQHRLVLDANTVTSGWLTGTTYAIGDKSYWNDIVYASLQAGNIGHQPDTSPTYWAVFTGPLITIAEILPIIYTGGTIATGMPPVTIWLDQDFLGNWPDPLWNAYLAMVNPGFESAIGTGWSTSPGPATVSTAASRNVLGIQAASDVTANDVIYQDVVGLTSGQTYVIEAWLYSDGSTSGFLTLNDSTGANVVTGSPANPGPTWTRLSLLYVANATGKVRIQLTHDATTGQIYWDDVGVYPYQGAYASDVGQEGISLGPNTRNTYNLSFHGTVWTVDSFRPNGSQT